MVVAIRGLQPWTISARSYDVVLYRPDRGRLRRMLQFPSAAPPWVGDLDADGDPEIVTWRQTSIDLGGCNRTLSPVVHTLVNGRYLARGEQFPSLTPVVADIPFSLASSLASG